MGLASHEWVMYDSCLIRLASHLWFVSHIQIGLASHEWVHEFMSGKCDLRSHTGISHVTRIENELCHTWMTHVTHNCVCIKTSSYVWHDAFMCVTQLSVRQNLTSWLRTSLHTRIDIHHFIDTRIHACDATVCHSRALVSRLVHMCDVMHLCVWHDSLSLASLVWTSYPYSCHTHGWMRLTHMSHVTHESLTSHIWMNRIKRMNESRCLREGGNGSLRRGTHGWMWWDEWLMSHITRHTHGFRI